MRDHFGQARNGAAEAEDQAELPHPRSASSASSTSVSICPLLDALARAHPEWQFAMVGPVVKIDPADLPRLPNIHYFGQRTYANCPPT